MNNTSPASELFDDIGVWSQATFAPDSERGPIGPLKHMVKEIEGELLGEGQDPTNIDEFADVLILYYDAARRAGAKREAISALFDLKTGLQDLVRQVSYMADGTAMDRVIYMPPLFDAILCTASLAGHSWPQLVEAAKRKMVKNKLRTYKKTTGDEVSEHDRSKD